MYIIYIYILTSLPATHNSEFHSLVRFVTVECDFGD